MTSNAAWDHLGRQPEGTGPHFAHYGVSLHSGIYNTLHSSFLVLNKLESCRSDLATANRPSLLAVARSLRCRPKWCQARRKECGLVNPNERRATMDGLIWGAALRDRLFLCSAALFLADVPLEHCARNALHSHKNGRVATTMICINRP